MIIMKKSIFPLILFLKVYCTPKCAFFKIFSNKISFQKNLNYDLI